MNIDKLTQAIQILVKEEVKRQLPKMVKRELKRVELSERVAKNPKPSHSKSTPTQPYTKNEILNEILSETKPFTAEQRNGINSNSVLDTMKPMTESSGREGEYDEWPTMEHRLNPKTPISSMRAQMEAEMGLTPKPSQGGLGVSTGLAGLDRVLNRDNSELVKRFKR